jgi:hypothetical protein
MFKYPEQFNLLIIKRFFVFNLFVACLQLGGLALTTLGSRFSILWFAHGVGLSLCFLRGKRVLPGIFLGSFLAYFLANTGLILALLLALLLTLQVFLLYWICERCAHPIPFLYQKKIFIKFIFYIIMITAINSLLMVLLCYPILYQPILSPQELFINWWLANLNGSLIFYLMLISCDVYFPQSDLISKKRKIFYIFNILFLISVILLLAMSQIILINILLILFILFYIIIIFSKFKQFGLISAIFITGFCLSLTAFGNTPIWHTDFSIQTLFYLQFVLSIFNIYCIYLSLQMANTEIRNLA